jgi:hypothetical protein
MKIGYEASDCPAHERAYYGGLLERLKEEFGKDFATFDCPDINDLKNFDGKFDLIIVKSRIGADAIIDQCCKSKSFLIDHGPIHCNRTYINWCRSHFEVFSSPTLQREYEATGFRPIIKGYSGGFFLTNSLDALHPDPKACLVYLIPWEGLRANSVTPTPFSEVDTVFFLRGLSPLFDHVHVVNHLCDGRANFAIRHRKHLPQNVRPVANGEDFRNLVCNVGAVIFEYSSVFAIALWNPEVRLFYRRPACPYGPLSPHNQIFHQIMYEACYLIVDDDVSAVKRDLFNDTKKDERVRAKKLIYDENIKDPYEAIINAIYDALALIANTAS